VLNDPLPADACSAHDLKLFLERELAPVVDSLDTDDPATAAAAAATAAAATDTTQLPPPPPSPPPPLQQTSSVEKLSTNFVNSKIENSKSTAAKLDCRIEDNDPDGWLTPTIRSESWKKWRAQQSERSLRSTARLRSSRRNMGPSTVRQRTTGESVLTRVRWRPVGNLGNERFGIVRLMLDVCM
jgi:hypothetical protein